MAIEDIYRAVLEFEDEAAARLVQGEIDGGTDTRCILDDGLIAAMDEVGALFGEGALFVPEMLMAAQAMKAGLEVLRPHLAEADCQPAGVVVIGTVKNDLHDIGKNLVAMMLEGAAFKVVDLGVDVEAAAFVEAARDNQADVVAMSALLTTTVEGMRTTVAALRERDNRIRIMIGGAPVDQAFADDIGADGFAGDAPGAVALARRLSAG